MRRLPPAVVLLLRRSLASAALLPAPRCLMRALLLDKRPATQASSAMTVRYFQQHGVTDSEGDEAIEAFNRDCSSTAGSNAPDDSACSDYVENLCRSGNLVDAVRVLRHLGNEQIPVSLSTFNVLLQHTAEANSFPLSAKVFRYLLLSKLAPDLSSYISVAKALQKVDDCELILKFIEQILEITQDRDPTVTNRIIFATAKYADLDKSLIIFQALKKDRSRLDAVTFNTILDVLGKAGRVDQMLQELKIMEEHGHSPDIVTYNTLINCLRRLGRLDLCKRFATEMLEKGVAPDLRTHTALIDSLGRAGHINDALEMFEQMKKSHQPSIYVYRALISNAKKAGWYDLAVKLSEEMNSSASDLIGPEQFKQKFKGRRIRNNR